MIYDELKNIKTYLGLHKNIDAAINFIVKSDLKKLPMGVTHLTEGLFYNHMNQSETDLLSPSEVVLESHKKYLDLHIVIDGDEQIGHDFIDNVDEKPVYNTQNEVMNYVKKPSKFIELDGSTFAIFFFQDGHAPKGRLNSAKNEKIVFKILYD